MGEKEREAVLTRLTEIRRLIDEIRDLWPVPNVESALRFAQLYCEWITFSLGGSDRFQFENSSFAPGLSVAQPKS